MLKSIFYNCIARANYHASAISINLCTILFLTETAKSFIIALEIYLSAFDNHNKGEIQQFLEII